MDCEKRHRSLRSFQGLSKDPQYLQDVETESKNAKVEFSRIAEDEEK